MASVEERLRVLEIDMATYKERLLSLEEIKKDGKETRRMVQDIRTDMLAYRRVGFVVLGIMSGVGGVASNMLIKWLT